MQTARGKGDPQGRKAKLANSYQALLDEFAQPELKSVGNYALGRLVGKGSFGRVYLAHHKLTNGSKVVLKSANKGDSNLAREIHHHRQFVHPHIARLYEVIVTESMVWLVLEYCAGDELYNYLLEHGPLPVPKVQKIFAQLVGAVTYVHKQSCVHRDLKLENILFDTHENVKLVDFGFTREYEGRTNHLQTFCGTICYSAPEMLKGEKYAGEKVDVWSLGVILYALLCGELPFDDDDDNVTRTRILTEEPKYPDHLSPDAVSLLKALLSKRPLPRPSLPDILAHPFIAEHAPAQQAILAVKSPAPFSTALENECLHRMRAAGVDTDAVIESVTAEKCDALAGWWTLLLEKETRKMQRRERKRKEREAETKSMRRISAASSRLERLAPMLQDVDEDGGLSLTRTGEGSASRSRGRSKRRSAQYYNELHLKEIPPLPDSGGRFEPQSPDEIPPTPIDKDSIRSVSTSRQRRPPPPPKEGVIRSARSRGSTLHLVTTSDALGGGSSTTGSDAKHGESKGRRKPAQVIVAHWKNWTHWIFENTTKRSKRLNEKNTSHSTPNLGSGNAKETKDVTPRPQTSKYPGSDSLRGMTSAPLPKGVIANGHAKGGASVAIHPSALRNGKPGHSLTSSRLQQHQPQPPGRIRTPSNSYKRQSLSPSPMTPRSGMRRSSAGLRGRKSTSSSVSSVRSLHHHRHSHSKASSTSSAASITVAKTPHRGQSPHHSVKVLPATPTSTAFPSNIRLVRAAPAPLSLYNEGMPSHNDSLGSPNPFAAGVMFAKRKKNLFKGPSLNFGGSPSGGHRNLGSAGHSRSGSGSALGRRSGEITIEEEDEDPSENSEIIEEVESFSPIVSGPGEIITEQILEDDEPTSTKDTALSLAKNDIHATDQAHGSEDTKISLDSPIRLK
ncbi:unnamed protein product [Clonostachys chloroleuca]|uniref:Protein kinase domain-containing protein n=1 Tax=Clonostachys chloroleuca TaxID=1926264 RepID=A0AA35QCN7_9HYPO|nr:unnamed protein product [Clonostachys chloroleuca]